MWSGARPQLRCTGRDTDLADLKRLDAGSWFGGAFEGERVPHLDDLAALHERPAEGSTSPMLGFDLEIKPAHHTADHVVSVVNSHLRSSAWARAVDSGQVVVTSFDPDVVELAASTLPVPVGLLLDAAPDPADLSTLPWQASRRSWWSTRLSRGTW